MEIQVKLHVYEDALMEAVAGTGASTIEEAISQELGWLVDSGMSVESWEEIESVIGPVFSQKDMLTRGDLNYLTNSAGDLNQINGKSGEELYGTNEMQWIQENWAETYALPCYGVALFQKPGILLSAEMYPETCVTVMPERKDTDMNALCDWMADRAQELSQFESLKNCALFVLKNTDAALNGDDCHELCCFIPCDYKGPDIQKAIQCFTELAYSYDALTPEKAKDYGIPPTFVPTKHKSLNDKIEQAFEQSKSGDKQMDGSNLNERL